MYLPSVMLSRRSANQDQQTNLICNSRSGLADADTQLADLQISCLTVKPASVISGFIFQEKNQPDSIDPTNVDMKQSLEESYVHCVMKNEEQVKHRSAEDLTTDL